MTIRWLAAAAALLLAPIAAHAATVSFSATVTSGSAGGAGVGDTVSGSVSYVVDPPVAGGGGLANYFGRATIATASIFPDLAAFTSNILYVFDDYAGGPPFDGYRWALETADYFFDLRLYSTDLGVASSFNLPTALNFPDFDFAAHIIMGSQTGLGFVVAKIDSLVVTPEPGSMALIGIGLLGLGLSRRPRHGGHR